MYTRTLLALSITTGFVAGCYAEAPQGPADPSRFAELDRLDDTEAPVAFEDEAAEVAAQVNASVDLGDLSGEFDNGVAVEGAADVSSYPEPGGVFVDLLRVEEGGAALALIDIWSPGANPLNAEFFWTAGSRAVYRDGIFIEGDAAGEPLSVFTTVCAGEDMAFDIDEPAPEVTVTITEGETDDERVVTIAATVDEGTLDSSFVIVR